MSAVARVVGRIAGLAALAALVGCGAETEAPRQLTTPVLMVEVVARDLEERIEATGELLAKNRAEIAAQVTGQVTENVADEGTAVAAGQVVVSIDPERRQLDVDDARARVAEAEATVAKERRELARSRALHGREIASKQQYELKQTQVKTAESRLLGARAQLGRAERALRDAEVIAPFDGLIARRDVSRGEYVQPGQKLFELVSLDPIEVEFHVSEVDAARVRVGLPVDVRLSPYPDEVFRAKVSVVSPTIDTRTRTLRVKALLTNPEGRLYPGLFARVDLGIDSRIGVAMVPEEAILQRADGAVVFRVVEASRVERVVVETGSIRDGWVEVVRPLRPGEVVIQRGHAELIDGSVVVAREADGSPVASVAAGAPADESARP